MSFEELSLFQIVFSFKTLLAKIFILLSKKVTFVRSLRLVKNKWLIGFKLLIMTRKINMYE